jgi:hypothetical protein
MFELAGLLTLGFGEAVPIADFGIAKIPAAGEATTEAAANAAWQAQYSANLEQQLAQHGAKSIRSALRSAEKTLAEHETKLASIKTAGGHVSGGTDHSLR